MAYWLSFWRMNRSWPLLGLLLVASLAYAGAACASTFGAEAPGLRAAGQDRCLTASASCIVVPQRIDVRVAAAAPSSPEPLPAAGGAEHAAGIFRTFAEPQSPAGLAPASPVPVHILLRRYLS